MGKYDNIFNSDRLTEMLSPEETVAAIAIVAIEAVKPNYDDAELTKLENILWESDFCADYSKDEITELVDRILDLTEQEDLGTLFNTAYQYLPDDLTLDAFEAAVIMLVEEGEVSGEGVEFLTELQIALEIPDEEAQEIIDAVLENVAEIDDLEVSEFEYYDSPTGNFSVPVPVEIERGGKIDSQPGVVTFSDDFGTLLRIDYWQADDVDAEAEKIENLGKESYLKAILDEYFSQSIQTSIPNAKIIYQEYLADLNFGAYFAVVDLPQGSTMTVSHNNHPPIRLNAYRGIVVFDMDDYMYVVSCQRNFLHDEEPGEIEDEAEELKDQLYEFVESIEFLDEFDDDD
ncbi:tellurite resistance TerB family protein [Aerosakkonemataceae cyanobacterium BLCC-F50]|uniref:Tellurite resistance TerB family protein n=1 Tax=Floridaenema flaviceps BLCC-F50 TaxID=3153642 RepID=A0ABV4Y160_9CYAN